MCYKSKFKVFCPKFKTAYAGGSHSIKDIEPSTVKQLQNPLAFIKMSYRNNVTKSMIVTTPDTVYK